jgi:hypothetical protein
VTSDYVLGQLMLVMIEVNQLLPHLIIPLALFTVPMKSKRKLINFGIDSTSLSSYYNDDDDDDDDTDSRD